MSNQERPDLQDILKLLDSLPHKDSETDISINATDTMSWLFKWLERESRVLDLSRGFEVNRCALYWTGYETNDAFDGQAFVDSCQDQNGSLRKLAQTLDTDLQIFELDPHNPQKADRDALALACSYGMMAIEESTQLFCACVFGAGVDQASQNALNALSKIESFDLDHFIENHFGLGHAAMLGAVIAATLKGIPVIIEGAAGDLVIKCLERTNAHSFSNIICTENMPDLPYHETSPGQAMVTTAVMLKTLYAGSLKTPCGKVKLAA